MRLAITSCSVAGRCASRNASDAWTISSHQVVVVEHQHDGLAISASSLIEPPQHDLAQRRARRWGHRQPAPPSPGDPPERGDHVAPEPDRILVGLIERDPGERPTLDRVPPGQQRRLPPARRSHTSVSRRSAPPASRSTSSSRGTNPARTPRNVQLRLDEDEPPAGAAAAFSVRSSCADRNSRCFLHVSRGGHRPRRTSAQARQPKAAVDASVRTMSQATQGVMKSSRTAARFSMRAGSPACFSSSLSGKWTAKVTMTITA